MGLTSLDAAAPRKRDPAGSQGLVKGSARSKCIDGVPAGPKFNCCTAQSLFRLAVRLTPNPKSTSDGSGHLDNGTCQPWHQKIVCALSKYHIGYDHSVA